MHVLFSVQDKVRTESYRDFMYSNPEVFRDKVSQLQPMQLHVHTLICLHVWRNLLAVKQKKMCAFSWQDINKVKASDLKHGAALY